MHKMRCVADNVLLDQSRAGCAAAFAELWRRHHGAGLKAAHAIAPSLDADDLVSEAFTKIFAQLGRGKGPTGGFRPYLYIVVRNTAVDIYRTDAGDVSLEDTGSTELADAECADLIQEFNLAATRKAFASLPEREQEVLWYSEVEGLPARKTARILGISPAATSALAMRARNHLRVAWLTEHASDENRPQRCADTAKQLFEYVRGRLSDEAVAEMVGHIATCSRCSELMHEAERIFVRPGNANAGLFSALGTRVALGAAAIAAGFVMLFVVALSAYEDRHTPATPVKGMPNTQVSDNLSLHSSVGRDSVTQRREERPAPETQHAVPAPAPTDTETDNPALVGGDTAADQEEPQLVPGAATPPPRQQPVTKYLSPAEPNEPILPERIDGRPQTLPELSVHVEEVGGHLELSGTGAIPHATVRVKLTSQPVADGPMYGFVMETTVSAAGTWNVAAIGGISPLNVTVQVQQLTETEVSPWSVVAQHATYSILVLNTEATEVEGVQSWALAGWPGAHWALREVGHQRPRIAGQFGATGKAAVEVPRNIGGGETREYEVGYWVKGRFVPNSERLTVTG